MWLLLLCTDARAGVWVRAPGEAWLQASVSGQTSERIFDATGAALPQSDATWLGQLEPLFSGGRYAGGELSLYGEVGVARRVELMGSVPLRYGSNTWRFAQGDADPVVQRNFGLGDASLGARVGGPVGRFALSAFGSLRAPLYDNAPERLNLEAGNSDFYDDRVPLGPGTIDLDLGLGAGTGLGWLGGWALTEAGVRVRDRSYSTVLPGRLQVGIHPTAPVATWLGLDGVLSLGDGAAPDDFVDAWGKGPTAIDHASWLSATLGGSVAVGRGFSLLATTSRVLTATRFPLLTSASLGLAWQTPETP